MKHILTATALTLIAAELSLAQLRPTPMQAAFESEQCKPQLEKMLSTIGRVSDAVPLKNLADRICHCASERLFRDKALLMVANSANEPVDPRLRPGDPKLQAYFLLRTTTAMHSCYATELDALAETIKPLQ